MNYYETDIEIDMKRIVCEQSINNHSLNYI